MGCHAVEVVIMHVHKYEIKITYIRNKDLRNLSRERYMKSMQ